MEDNYFDFDSFKKSSKEEKSSDHSKLILGIVLGIAAMAIFTFLNGDSSKPDDYTNTIIDTRVDTVVIHDTVVLDAMPPESAVDTDILPLR